MESILKKIIFLLIILVAHTVYTYAEGDTLKFFNGKEYILKDSIWNEYYSTTNQYFPIDGNALTIKYSESVSPESIASFETQYGLTNNGKNILGYYDYLISNSDDIFVKANQILSSNLIDKINIISKKYLYKDVIGNNGGGCDQWYLDVNQAWSITMGSPNVTVAVIDAGFDISHPDFGYPNSPPTGGYSNVFKNPGETGLDANGNSKETNGVDDDQNGYVDDVNGWNFFDNNNNIYPNSYHFNHGLNVSSVIAAKTYNNYLIDGIAGGNNSTGVQILPIKIVEQISNNPYPANNQSINDAKLDEAIIYAVDMGAKIINMSFWCAPSPDIDAALDYAYDHGVFITSGTGNDWGGPVTYPANYVKCVAVSAFSQVTNNTSKSLSNFSNFGPEVSFGARGHNVCVLNSNPNPNIGYEAMADDGTSFSAPTVAATAALMLSANTCLSNQSIFDIMKNTADRTGYAYNFTTNQDEPVNYGLNPSKLGHSDEFGYGLININKAVTAAYLMQTSSFTKDLYLKDADMDFGYMINNNDPIQFNNVLYVDPDYFSWQADDQSPDIWVRNVDDNGLQHQNPEYTQGQPVWVYVRIRNKGCVASGSEDKVSLYWSKAASWSSWPNNWDGSNPTIGNLIGESYLGTIKPGEEKIYKFQWNLDVAWANNGWKSCLLARIQSPDDQITEFPNRLDRLIAENNNVAIHNVTIVNAIPGAPHVVIDNVRYPYGGFMYLSNPLSEDKSYNFNFSSFPLKGDGILTKEAEVTLKFGQEDWDLLVSNGLLNNEGVKEIRERELLIENPNVTFANLNLPESRNIPVYVGFSFLTDEITSNQEYGFRVSQYFSDSASKKLGSENYIIKKYSRVPFQADAGPDKTIFPNQSTTLIATELSELATYKWYDSKDSLIYIGTNLTVSPTENEKYKLEVIADIDGFKDYDDVEVKIKTGSITSLYPNPVTETLNLEYSLDNVTSAYVMIMQPFSTTSNNVTLDVQQNAKTIDMANYSSGVYNVFLVCDGSVLDVKSIQKQ